MTEETFEYARKKIVREIKEIDLEMLKAQIKRKQKSVKMLELKMAYEIGETKCK